MHTSRTHQSWGKSNACDTSHDTDSAASTHDIIQRFVFTLTRPPHGSTENLQQSYLLRRSICARTPPWSHAFPECSVLSQDTLAFFTSFSVSIISIKPRSNRPFSSKIAVRLTLPTLIGYKWSGKTRASVVLVFSAGVTIRSCSPSFPHSTWILRHGHTAPRFCSSSDVHLALDALPDVPQALSLSPPPRPRCPRCNTACQSCSRGRCSRRASACF